MIKVVEYIACAPVDVDLEEELDPGAVARLRFDHLVAEDEVGVEWCRHLTRVDELLELEEFAPHRGASAGGEQREFAPHRGASAGGEQRELPRGVEGVGEGAQPRGGAIAVVRGPG